MRKSVLYIAMSLDGFIAKTNGDVSFLGGDDSDNRTDLTNFAKFYETIDTIIMGHQTFHEINKVLSPNEWPYQNKLCLVLTNSLFLNETSSEILNNNQDLSQKTTVKPRILSSSIKNVFFTNLDFSYIINILKLEHLEDTQDYIMRNILPNELNDEEIQLTILTAKELFKIFKSFKQNITKSDKLVSCKEVKGQENNTDTSKNSYNIWICGGASIARQCIAQNLCDEIGITIVPMILGEGIRLFNKELINLSSGKAEGSHNCFVLNQNDKNDKNDKNIKQQADLIKMPQIPLTLVSYSVLNGMIDLVYKRR